MAALRFTGNDEELLYWEAQRPLPHGLSVQTAGEQSREQHDFPPLAAGEEFALPHGGAASLLWEAMEGSQARPRGALRPRSLQQGAAATLPAPGALSLRSLTGNTQRQGSLLVLRAQSLAAAALPAVLPRSLVLLLPFSEGVEGIAHLLGDRLPQVTLVLEGAPCALSWEAAERLHVAHRGPQASLWQLLSAAVAGRRPWDGDTLEATAEGLYVARRHCCRRRSTQNAER